MIKITISNIVDELKEKYKDELSKNEFDSNDLDADKLFEYGKILYENSDLQKPISHLAVIISLAAFVFSASNSLPTWAIIIFGCFIGVLCILLIIFTTIDYRKSRKLSLLKKAKFLHDIKK